MTRTRTCKHAYIRTYIHTYTYACYLYIYIYMFVLTCVNTYIHKRACCRPMFTTTPETLQELDTETELFSWKPWFIRAPKLELKALQLKHYASNPKAS